MAKKISKDFFVYSTGRISVAALATVTTNINFTADSDFEALKLTGSADVAGAAQTANTRVIPNVTIMLTDTGSGRNFMNTGIPFSALFGSGESPFIMPLPKIIQARSNLQITFVSFEAVNTNVIELSFIGNKVYVYDEPGR